MGYEAKPDPQSAERASRRDNRRYPLLPCTIRSSVRPFPNCCRTLGEWGFIRLFRLSQDKVASCRAAIKLHQQARPMPSSCSGSRYHAEELAVGSVPCVVIGEVPPQTQIGG